MWKDDLKNPNEFIFQFSNLKKFAFRFCPVSKFEQKIKSNAVLQSPSWMYFRANWSLACICFLDSNGFFLATLPLYPYFLIDLLIVSFETIFPLRFLRFSTKAPEVINGFDSTSLLMNLDSRISISWGRPVRGRSLTVPCWLCFWTMYWIVDFETPNLSEIFLKPYPSECSVTI